MNLKYLFFKNLIQINLNVINLKLTYAIDNTKMKYIKPLILQLIRTLAPLSLFNFEFV